MYPLSRVPADLSAVWPRIAKSTVGSWYSRWVGLLWVWREGNQLGIKMAPWVLGLWQKVRCPYWCPRQCSFIAHQNWSRILTSRGAIAISVTTTQLYLPIILVLILEPDASATCVKYNEEVKRQKIAKRMKVEKARELGEKKAERRQSRGHSSVSSLIRNTVWRETPRSWHKSWSWRRAVLVVNNT